MTKPPSFLDQLHVYATYQELYRYMIEPDVLALLGDSPVRIEDVVERIAEIPFEPAMRLTAGLQKGLSFGRTDVTFQRALAVDVYGDSPLAHAAQRFLDANENGVIFSEQQIFALQRLLVLHAAEGTDAGLSREQDASLRLALFYVPGTVLAEEEDLDSAADYVGYERWLGYFVGNGGFAARGWLKHDLARAHYLYEVLAKSRLVREHVDRCPLDEWLRKTYDMSFMELQAFGFVMHAGSQMLSDNGPPLAVTPAYFATSALAEKVQDGFRAFAATRDWYRAEFERSGEHPRRAAYEIQPFLRRPGLLLGDGNVLPVAPRAIEGWLSPSGAYYRLLDIARDEGEGWREKFSRFNGMLHEHYARQLVHAAHPYPGARRRSGAVGLVYPGKRYLVKKQEAESTDIALDLGLDLLLFEVTAKRLTEKTLTKADADSVRDDMRMMIEKKIKQLGRVIADMRMSGSSWNLGGDPCLTIRR